MMAAFQAAPKRLLRDCAIERPEMAITIRDGHPIFMRDGGSPYDRWELSGNECVGNFYNMVVRWRRREGFEAFLQELAGHTKPRFLSEYWSFEIMSRGMGLYELTGGSRMWQSGLNTYEDFMDSEQAAAIRFDVRAQVSKIKSRSAFGSRMQSAGQIARQAVEAWTASRQSRELGA